jgi:hypothetical protein
MELAAVRDELKALQEMPEERLGGPDPNGRPGEGSTQKLSRHDDERPIAGASSLALTTTGPDAQHLEMELAAVRDELKALQEMLEDLPEIYERKFQQRLATVMEHQKHLLDDNQSLREIVKGGGRPMTTPPPPPPSALKPTRPAAPDPAPSKPSPSGLTQPNPRVFKAIPASKVSIGLAIGLGLVAVGAAVATVERILVRQASVPALKPETPAKVPTPQPPSAPGKTTHSKPSPSQTSPAQAAAAKPAPNLLVLNSLGPNWVEVRTLSRQRVFEGMLKGEKTLPLGQGLQVLAGRPDLLTVRQGAGPPKVLGRINELVWISFKPQAPPAPNPAPIP